MSDVDLTQEWPMVSVIVPVYNCEPYLQQTLDSIYAQNYPNLEIVVVNDGSTDGTSKIAQNNIKHIKYYEKENGGPAAARNYGVSKSNGDFLAFLDSDDIWVPNHLKKQIRFLLDNEQYSVCFGKFDVLHQRSDGSFPELKKIEEDYDYLIDTDFTGKIYHKMLFDSWVHVITAVVRKELFLDLEGFNENLPRGEDYDFWIRASRVANFVKIDETLAIYRKHNSSITSKPSYINYQFLVVKNFIEKYGYSDAKGGFIEKKTINNHLAMLCFSHAYLNFYFGNKRASFENFLISFKYNPWNFKTWGYVIFSGLFALFSHKIDTSGSNQ